MNPELLDPQLWLQYAAKYPLLALLAFIWAGFILDLLTFRKLRNFLGIRPRRFLYLPTIFTAPFFHVDGAHLLSNSIPLAIMGFLSANLLPLPKYLLLLLIAAAGSGFGVWLFGRNAIMLGASGLVFAICGIGGNSQQTQFCPTGNSAVAPFLNLGTSHATISVKCPYRRFNQRFFQHRVQ